MLTISGRRMGSTARENLQKDQAENCRQLCEEMCRVNNNTSDKASARKRALRLPE
jgi:hypothetical protein